MPNRVDTFTGSQHFRLNQVTDGVFAAIAIPGKGSLGNAAIIDLGDATLVVDTFNTPEAAKDLQAAAIHLTDRAATYVLNTHWHSDHTSGNQVFVPHAQIIATSTTRDIMAKFGKSRLAEQLANPQPIYEAIAQLEEKIQQEPDEKLKRDMQWENASDLAYMKALPDLTYTLPTVTFEEQMRIHGRERLVQIMTYGGGHTKSDAFVYLPEERLAIMGDLVLSKHHPFMLSGDPIEWLRILDRVEELDIDTIVPGHGEVCSMQELREIRGYINAIMALVKDEVQREIDLEKILVPDAYKDWYFTPYFQPNLKRIYELLGG